MTCFNPSPTLATSWVLVATPKSGTNQFGNGVICLNDQGQRFKGHLHVVFRNFKLGWTLIGSFPIPKASLISLLFYLVVFMI
jgi:hypothetical protein